MQKEKRGVGVFLPTRAGVEEVAEDVSARAPRIETAFYHGGEPIRVIRPFLEGEVRKPYVLSMTAAGQSALNVRGLDTVIIDDTRFTNFIEGGKNVLTRTHLGANEILQMAGRVHGRVEGGRVFLLSDRDIVFSQLRPTEPEFQLAGDSERVAITCADLGVRADELDLPVPLDRVAYREALARLSSRGIIDERGRLSQYGKNVEAVPVDRPWGELIVHADDGLVPYIAVMSSVESLHRMTREDRYLEGLVVAGSDHLTAYNVYAEAYRKYGRVGEVYGLPRHLFDDGIDEWAERRGVLVKAIEDAALGMASVYRNLEMPLPEQMALANDGTLRGFQELLARIMPFDLVIDEMTADGEEARVSKTSVAGSWGAIAGELRYFADRSGVPRAAIEGTQIPLGLIRKYATRGEAEIVFDADRRRAPLVVRRAVEYYGFVLERDIEPIDDVFPEDVADIARAKLADAAARFEARHRSLKDLRPRIEEVREVWRRSGGRTAKLGTKELASIFADQLRRVRSFEEFRAIPLVLDIDALVPPAERARWMALPDTVSIRDREVPIEYAVEDGVGGVARLRLPEKMARTLVDAEVPTLDRPVRFVVTRGQRGAVRASTLDELQDLLDRPWAPDEEEPRRHHAREGRSRGNRVGADRGRSRHERGRGRSRRRRR
jgi:hypothetical protein